jgi:hypothetical protein
VVGVVEVLGGVLVLRAVAAADVAAGEAKAEVDPAVADLEAIFAAGGAGGDGANLGEVGAGFRHGGLLAIVYARQGGKMSTVRRRREPSGELPPARVPVV